MMIINCTLFFFSSSHTVCVEYNNNTNNILNVTYYIVINSINMLQ